MMVMQTAFRVIRLFDKRYELEQSLTVWFSVEQTERLNLAQQD